jgi:hypothetical protein
MKFQNIEYIPNKKTEKILLGLPNDIMYTVARITLDMSMKKVPMSRGKTTSGQLRRSTTAYGVRGSDGNYSIGSAVSYAKYVYKMPDSNNFTTPGTSGKWFHKTFKQHQVSIVKNAIAQTKKG